MRQILLLMVGIGLAASVHAAAPQDFSKYQVIIDRSPFGPVNAASAPELIPNFAQRFQFVALVMSNAGQGPLQAILFDQEANRSHFRAAGELIDGRVKVVRIEQKPAPKVVLQDGLETAQLTFQDKPAPPTSAKPFQQLNAQPAVAPPVPPVIQRRLPFRRGN